MDTSNYLFHGTSSLYIPYILKYGLNGKYPEELYNDLLFFWDKIPEKNSDKLTYINSFIDRQKNVRINKTISISLTTEYEVAKEYANGSRNNGEGPGYMMDLIHHNKDDINPRLNMEEKKRLDELFKKNDGYKNVSTSEISITKSSLRKLKEKDIVEEVSK